jgi:hypothetical protein
MADYLQLNENWAVYHMFTKEFVRIVVGKKVWKNSAYRLNLSEYCAASSEAFSLLVVENNYQRWTDMVNSGDLGDKHNSASAPLYTNAGKSNRKNGKAKPFQGWTAEGYQRFDVIYNCVKADRASATRISFEEELKNLMMEEHSRKKQGKQNDVDDGEEVTYPSHDFDDVLPGGTSNLPPLVQQGQPKQAQPKQAENNHNNSSDSESSQNGEDDEGEGGNDTHDEYESDDDEQNQGERDVPLFRI